MKLEAKIVKLNSYDGKIEYCDNGWLREIQIIEEGVVVHKSGGNHPECFFETEYNGFVFYTPSYKDEVFVKVTNDIEFK